MTMEGTRTVSSWSVAIVSCGSQLDNCHPAMPKGIKHQRRQLAICFLNHQTHSSLLLNIQLRHPISNFQSSTFIPLISYISTRTSS